MARTRPNIVMITPDEWRADALGCAGNSVVKTPCMDALAESGVLFRNAYTPAPMCVPARMSILTGQSPRVHGAMTNGLSPTDNVSIAAILRENGYRTSAFGKMHFLPAYCDFGFDVLQLSEQDGEGWRIDDYHRWLWDKYGLVDWIDLWDQVEDYRNEAPSWFRGTYGALKSPILEEAYHTTWITDRFLEYLDGLDAAQPFFSWIGYIKPHHPFDPPGRYAELYDPSELPLPEPDDLSRKPLVADFDPRQGRLDISRWSDVEIRTMIAMYYGTITQIDDNVGRIVEGLRRKGIAEETVILINSDHGDFLGHHRFITKAPFVPYEDLIRVPFIVYDPRNPANGRVSDAFVSLLDLFPTIAAMSGVSHTHTVHGHDLTPLLRAEAESVTDVAFAENHRGVIAVRQGPWKLLQSEKGACELYNLDNDPGERCNRFPEMRDSKIVTGLRDAALRSLMGYRWDRLYRDMGERRRLILEEGRKRGLPMLNVAPGDWRGVWSEDAPRYIG